MWFAIAAGGQIGLVSHRETGMPQCEKMRLQHGPIRLYFARNVRGNHSNQGWFQFGADRRGSWRRRDRKTNKKRTRAMNELLLEYLPIILFLALGAIVGIVFLVLAFVIAPFNPDPEKVSTFECGFNSFDDARMTFQIRFYLVSILFIIFDLEVAFLFPWAIALKELGPVGFWSMMVFLGILTIGFIYEWKKGALEWN